MLGQKEVGSCWQNIILWCSRAIRALFRSNINLVIVSVSCPQFGLPIAVILIWPRWYTLSNDWVGRLFMEKRNASSIHYFIESCPLKITLLLGTLILVSRSWVKGKMKWSASTINKVSQSLQICFKTYRKYVVRCCTSSAMFSFPCYDAVVSDTLILVKGT